MPIKIGVISDTHLKKPTPLLEKAVEGHFHDVDIIIHAGDVVSPEVLEIFRGKTLYVVSGNRDNAQIKRRYPETHTLEIQGFRIGLVHGWGPPFGIQKRVLRCFHDVHCIVFGHSHIPLIKESGGVVLFNPGAFCGGVLSLWRRTIGIIMLNEGIHPEIRRVR